MKKFLTLFAFLIFIFSAKNSLADTLIYSSYIKTNALSINNNSLAETFNSGNYCTLKTTSISLSTKSGTCLIKARLIDGIQADGTIKCSTETIPTGTGTTTFNWIGCSIHPNTFYTVLYWTDTTCSGITADWQTITNYDIGYFSQCTSVPVCAVSNLSPYFNRKLNGEIWTDNFCIASSTPIINITNNLSGGNSSSTYATSTSNIDIGKSFILSSGETLQPFNLFQAIFEIIILSLVSIFLYLTFKKRKL